MNDSPFEFVITSSWNLLGRFYERKPELNILDFVCYANNHDARVLIDEHSEADTVFFSIEIPRNIKNDYEKEKKLDTQTLSVVCEELSHFYHLVAAAELEKSVGVLQLEALAEIDRFVSFLHWNTFHPEIAIEQRLSNCQQVYDILFEQRKFIATNQNLYRDAESLAFHHLRRAFSHCWTQRYIDTRAFDPRARKYISSLFHHGSFEQLSA
jgi:hypothetical protein